MPKCACGVTACFGQKGKSASCCVRCKTDDMINVVDALCLECNSRALFNIPGKTGGVYCSSHIPFNLSIADLYIIILPSAELLYIKGDLSVTK